MIALGLLLLLESLDVVRVGPETFFAGLFGVGAYLFWKQYAKGGSFGVLLLAYLAGYVGLAVINSSAEFLPEELFGPIFLWGAGAAFGLHWLQRRRESWGFLLVAGIGFTLGFVAFTSNVLWWMDLAGVVFFLGLAGTFFALHRVFEASGRLAWAKYAAAISTIFAAMIFADTTDSPVGELLTAAVLISLGGYFIWQAVRQERQQTRNLGSV
jgi:hypothetical protein